LKTVPVDEGSGKVDVYQAFLQAFAVFRFCKATASAWGVEYPPPPQETIKKRVRTKKI
jgi:hypothetical protein